MQANWPLAWQMYLINVESGPRTAAQAGLAELFLEYQQAAYEQMRMLTLP
jgi:hypothetical protein